MPETSGQSLAESHHSDTSTDSHQGGRKLSVGASAIFTDSRKKGSNEGWCYIIQLHFHQLSRLVHLPIFRSMDRHYFQWVCA